jgi:uncharacterized protein (TIGR03083 family)
MPTDLDFLAHLDRESARFAEALRDAPSDARVPTCPDWDADDLLWHLGGVQQFWGEVVRRGVTEKAEADKLEPSDDDRPATRAGLEDFYRTWSAVLAQVLTDNDPATAAWTWSNEQSVGFIRRRQAHEALVHRLDAELTAGSRTPMDPALCADGVDEVLRVMYGGDPPWGSKTLDENRTIRVRTTDTADSWLVTLARFTGTDPDDGVTYDDEPDIHVAADDAGGAAEATVSGTAEDLDCWLWQRPPLTEPVRDGDLSVLEAFESTISAGIN